MAAQMFDLILISPHRENDQFQPFALKRSLYSFQHGHEEGIAISAAIRRQRQNEGHRPRPPTAKRPAGLIGRVAKRKGSLHHTAPGFRVHIPPVIERARNRTDRQIEVLGQAANVHAFNRRQASLLLQATKRIDPGSQVTVIVFGNKAPYR